VTETRFNNQKKFSNNIAKVWAIVLNYNNFHDTERCVLSLMKTSYSQLEILVVDNHSTDGSKELISDSNWRCHKLLLNTNLGYANGNNQGIEYALNNFADYFLIVNSDVEVTANFLNPLVELMNRDGSVGVCGPVILDHSSPHLIQSAGSIVNLFLCTVRQIYRGQEYSKINKNVPGRHIEVSYVSGACILVKKSVILDVGKMPELYFLFFEETEWCLRIRNAKWRVCCVLTSAVYHKGSASINVVSKQNGMKEFYLARNRIFFIRRNGSLINRIMLPFIEGIRIVYLAMRGRLTLSYLEAILEGFSYRAVNTTTKPILWKNWP
jgi:GT2 family glycosyltransferase